MDIYSLFINGDVRFLTFRGKKDVPRQQTIGFITDHIKKVSSTFYVVRETDQDGVNYHFHAILKLNKIPPSSWYLKHAHIHMTKVGYVSPVGLLFTRRDVLEAPVEEESAMLNDNLEKRLTRLFAQARQRVPAIEKIASYMSKEQVNPVQYVNYVLFVHGCNARN